MSFGQSNAAAAGDLAERTDSPRPDTAPVLEVRGLSKEFQGRAALRSLNLRVHRGETVAILGPNGAGKTTLLRIMSTLARPTSGTVFIGGHDASKAGPGLRRAIGFLGHQTFLYDDLSAEENLVFYGRMYDVPDLSARIDETLAGVGLDHRRHDRARVFSRGMQQRLSLARAVLHRPPLLLLDEPDSGLDPEATQSLRRLLHDVQVPERSVVLATHDFEFAHNMADRFVILAAGKVVWEGGKDDLSLISLPDRYRETIRASLDRGR